MIQSNDLKNTDLFYDQMSSDSNFPWRKIIYSSRAPKSHYNFKVNKSYDITEYDINNFISNMSINGEIINLN